MREENIHLRAKLAWFQKQLFAAGKGERVSTAQLELLLSGLAEHTVETPIDLPHEESDSLVNELERQKPDEAEETGFKQVKRYQLPEPIKVEERYLDPEEVTADPQAYKMIGEEVTEELDIEPATFKKIRTIRRKYVFVNDKNLPPIIAPAPKRLIDRGIASAGLLVFIIISKYCDHLPLYRQESIFRKRYGVRIRRKAMCEWIAKIADDWLYPIYNQMYLELMLLQYIQADETPIKYQDPDGKQTKKAKQGYFWVYSSPRHYERAPKKASHPKLKLA